MSTRTPSRNRLLADGTPLARIADALAEAEGAPSLRQASRRAGARRRPGSGCSTANWSANAADLDAARALLRGCAANRTSSDQRAGRWREDGASDLAACRDATDLTMRDFSDAFLDDYLATEGDELLAGVGCYRLEGHGRAAFRAHRRRLLLHSRTAAAAAAGGAARTGCDRAMSLTGAGRIAGIIGWPVRAFPVAAPAWLLAGRSTGSTAPRAAPGAAGGFLASSCARLCRPGFAGVNVTVPHKEAAFALAHDCDLAARAAGAVNLLVFRDDGTDRGPQHRRDGSCREPCGEAWRRCAAGKAGGIAGRRRRGARRGAGAARSGCGRNPHPQSHRGRAEAAGAALCRRTSSQADRRQLEDWPKAAADAALVVNATSAGMKGAPSLDLALDPLAEGRRGLRHRLQSARNRSARSVRARAGLRTIDGLGMLMHQAVPAFEAFFGVDAEGDAGAARRTREGAASWLSGHSSSASPAPSAWARPRRRRCSRGWAFRSTMPTPRCTGSTSRAARRSPKSRRPFPAP